MKKKKKQKQFYLKKALYTNLPKCTQQNIVRHFIGLELNCTF